MNKSTPKVSIIVSIYNVEKYLRQCLDSIVGQTLHDIEIILINDGSTDGSLKIMEEYAQGDKRVQIISKPNEGYGKTMNLGLDTAIGEYIGIVESDDWTEKCMYETLYALAKMNDCDVVKSNYFNYIDGKDTKNEFLPPYLLNKIVCARNHQNNEIALFYLQASVWSAIYRRDFINKRKIRFLESASASYQDTAFNFKVWALADKVWLTPEAFIHYREHPGQSVASTEKVFCVCDEWQEIDRFMNDYPEWKKSSAKLRNHVKKVNYDWNLHRIKAVNKEAFRRRFAEEYKNALKNNEFDLSVLSKKERLRFLYILEPNNVWLKLLNSLLNVWDFLKSILRKNKKLYLLLKKIKAKISTSHHTQNWPTFYKKELM